MFRPTVVLGWPSAAIGCQELQSGYSAQPWCRQRALGVYSRALCHQQYGSYGVRTCVVTPPPPSAASAAVGRDDLQDHGRSLIVVRRLDGGEPGNQVQVQVPRAPGRSWRWPPPWWPGSRRPRRWREFHILLLANGPGDRPGQGCGLGAGSDAGVFIRNSPCSSTGWSNACANVCYDRPHYTGGPQRWDSTFVAFTGRGMGYRGRGEDTRRPAPRTGRTGPGAGARWWISEASG